MMLPQEIIRIKRNGQTLNDSQINSFVNGLVDGSFSDSQVGAMAMAIFQKGMSVDEKVTLTKAMMNSGDVLSWVLMVGGIHIVNIKDAVGLRAGWQFSRWSDGTGKQPWRIWWSVFLGADTNGDGAFSAFEIHASRLARSA